MGGHSAKGLFVGMKLTLVLEYPFKHLLFLLHPANRREARIFREVMNVLKRRKILWGRDTIIMDKGFYAYRNYLVGINKYIIVLLIFPRNNFKLRRLDRLLSYPLSIFNSRKLKKQKRRFRALKAKLMNLLKRWNDFKPVRSAIEDVFKLARSMSLRKLHRHMIDAICL